MRSVRAGALIVVLAASVAHAAESRPAAREVWSGTYTCGAMERDPDQRPGYSSRAQLVLEDGTARVTRESARMRETLTGQVAADGSVRLEGSGDSKEGGGARWRYRFEGKFEGDRFTAKGAMLSTNLATKLRDCSMALTRVQGTAGPAPRQPAEAAVSPQPQRMAVPAVAKAEKPPASVAASSLIRVIQGKELNFAKGNDAAVIHGKVSRSTPHRYPITAKKGQTISIKLHSDGGARFDIYEAGATIDMHPNGFVVQGTQLKGAVDGSKVSTDLPSDGTYLLLVRALREEAAYTLEVATRGPPSADGTGASEDWLNDKTLWTVLLLVLVAAGGGIVVYSKRDRRMFRTR